MTLQEEIQSLEHVPADRKITGQKFSHLLNSNNKIPCSRDLRLLIPGLDTVREISNILSQDECNSIISVSSSSTEGFSRPTAFNPEARDCQRIHTVDKEMSTILISRLKPYLPEIVKIDGVRWQLSRFTHHWRYVRYHPGGHFSPHYDGVKMSAKPIPCMTIFTVQIYLNGRESFSGGSTRFYADYKPQRLVSHEIPYGHVSDFHAYSEKEGRLYVCTPETGKALIFNHALNTLHDGEPVSKGTKFIMRGDILYTAHSKDVQLLPSINRSESLTVTELSARHWCPVTASKHGTRNHIGEVWYCVCATDKHGAMIEGNPKHECWHNEELTDEMRHESFHSKQPKPDGVKPKLLVLLSGKRTVGKDFIADLLDCAFSSHGFTVYRSALGNVNKKLYAEKFGIEVERLFNDRDFKETHRAAMIEHHKQLNAADPEWCLMTVLEAASGSDIMILSDLRTSKDLNWFKNQEIPVMLLRITASNDARKDRGWVPCPLKDALFTETDLDSYNNWTACWDNSDNSGNGKLLLQTWIEFTVLPRMVAILHKT